MKSLAVVFWLSVVFTLPCGANVPPAASAAVDPDIELLQTRLRQTSTAVLSYSLKAGELHVEVVTEQDALSLCLPAGSVFFSRIMKLKNSLHSQAPFDRQLAHQLYLKLIGPVTRYLSGKTHLVIIPCQKTGLVPFEVLVPDTANAKRYLLHDFAISYSYGYAALLNRRPALSDYERQKVLAVAPFNVPSAEKEVMNIRADYVLGQAASKKRFIEKAKNYSIIHLATHASLADPPHSFIDFSPEGNPLGDARSRMSVQDIARMRLENVDLVVLSPCLQFRQGTSLAGLYTMAKAFAQAGCPNFITTLWKTGQGSNHRISMKLHQYIHQGYDYPQALRKARIDYLENPSVDENLKSPAYWAGFVLLGEITPARQSHKIFYYFALAFTALVTGYILRRKKHYRS